MIRMTIRTPVMTMKHEHFECLMGGCAYEKLGAIMCKIAAMRRTNTSAECSCRSSGAKMDF